MYDSWFLKFARTAWHNYVINRLHATYCRMLMEYIHRIDIMIRKQLIAWVKVKAYNTIRVHVNMGLCCAACRVWSMLCFNDNFVICFLLFCRWTLQRSNEDVTNANWRILFLADNKNCLCGCASAFKFLTVFSDFDSKHWVSYWSCFYYWFS